MSSASPTQIVPFLPNGPYVALPNSRAPRLFMPLENPPRRWRKSGFYPAFRKSARAYRVLLRAKAAAGLAGLAGAKEAPDTWPLKDFVADILPETCSVAVLLGAPGLAQKITVQLWSEHEVVGYLKFAEKPLARKGLCQEYGVLSKLPPSAPKPLKFGPFAGGIALVTAPIRGRALPARLPPVESLSALLRSWATETTYHVTDHPWIRRLASHSDVEIGGWLEALSTRTWNLVVQHGDFAPWNVLRGPGGQLSAIDWERGTIKGFPFFDLAYYMLRVAALIYHWSPGVARAYAMRQLNKAPWPGLSVSEAKAIIELTAYHSCKGEPDDSRLRAWHRAIWEEPPR